MATIKRLLPRLLGRIDAYTLQVFNAPGTHARRRDI
jgi:hypothetical protein